jgi:hypothetical protein
MIYVLLVVKFRCYLLKSVYRHIRGMEEGEIGCVLCTIGRSVNGAILSIEMRSIVGNANRISTSCFELTSLEGIP